MINSKILRTSIIWIYWQQGIDSAPPIVRRCIDSWRYHNPNYQIKILDDITVGKYIQLDNIFWNNRMRSMTIAARSDVIRINLLERYGGIWVDATLMCLKPLDSWINPYLTHNGFFAFDRPGPDRLISSWMLSANKESYIPQQWSIAVNKYWSAWKFRRKYYWFHYLFNTLYANDPIFRKEWESVNKISADGPHYFVPFREKFFESASERNVQTFEAADLPVVKLTYKCLKNGYPKDSMIDYLLNKREF